MTKTRIRILLKSMRPPFLILTPVSIFLGFCISLKIPGQVDILDLLLVLFGAMSAHVSVNTYNEYFDFHSGLDSKTSKTPFSGGSGALIANPKIADKVLCLAIITLSMTILIGLYFVYRHGTAILPIGVVGVLIILTYTQWLNRWPWLCLIAPGLGFGPLMVVGTYFVLTGGYSVFAILASLVPFFLVNNLLLLNQYPDLQADESVGRRHFPIVYGTKNSTIVYGTFAVAAGLAIIAGIILEYLPQVSLVSLIPMSAAAVVYWGAMKYASDAGKLMPYLAVNVLVTVLTPLVFGVTLISG